MTRRGGDELLQAGASGLPKRQGAVGIAMYVNVDHDLHPLWRLKRMPAAHANNVNGECVVRSTGKHPTGKLLNDLVRSIIQQYRCVRFKLYGMARRGLRDHHLLKYSGRLDRLPQVYVNNLYGEWFQPVSVGLSVWHDE